MQKKLFYKIGEVSKITKLPEHTLRIWEKKIKEFNPKRTDRGQRLYSQSDIEIIKKIKNLISNEKLTIEGAQKALRRKKTNQNDDLTIPKEIVLEKLIKIRQSIADIIE